MLQTTRVNQEIWNQVKPDTRSKDIKLQRVAAKLTKGMIPLVNLVDSLLKVSEKGEGLAAEDIAPTIRQTLEGLTLLANANFDLNMRRRDIFKEDVNPSFKSLCSPHIPLTTNLFGDDISKTVKEIGETNRLGQRMYTGGKGKHSSHNQRRPFLGHRSSHRGGHYKKGYRHNSNSSGGRQGGNRGYPKKKAVVPCSPFMREGSIFHRKVEPLLFKNPRFVMHCHQWLLMAPMSPLL